MMSGDAMRLLGDLILDEVAAATRSRTTVGVVGMQVDSDQERFETVLEDIATQLNCVVLVASPHPALKSRALVLPDLIHRCCERAGAAFDDGLQLLFEKHILLEFSDAWICCDADLRTVSIFTGIMARIERHSVVEQSPIPILFMTDNGQRLFGKFLQFDESIRSKLNVFTLETLQAFIDATAGKARQAGEDR